jgi:hypothetical protein
VIEIEKERVRNIKINIFLKEIGEGGEKNERERKREAD